MIDPLEETSAFDDQRKRSADARPVCRLSLSLFRSFARGRRRRQKNIDDAKKRDIYQNIFRIQKDHPPPKEKGSLPRKLYRPPTSSSSSFSSSKSRAAHTKKTYLHRRRRNLRASERRRSLRGRRRRRANRRERLDGERGGQHFIYVILLCVLVFG